MKKILLVLCCFGLMCGHARAVTKDEMMEAGRKTFMECMEKFEDTDICLPNSRIAELLVMYDLKDVDTKRLGKDITVCYVQHPEMEENFEYCVYDAVSKAIWRA